jgi:hypothetical protein
LEVVTMTAERLAAKSLPDAEGRFNPDQVAVHGMDGFRSWLRMMAYGQAADWVPG